MLPTKAILRVRENYKIDWLMTTCISCVCTSI